MLSKRFLSTAAGKARFTQLTNGLVIASKKVPSTYTTIGVYTGAGSRAENPYNSGVSSLLVQSLANASKDAAAKEGVVVESENYREVSSISTTIAKGNEAAAFKTLESILTSSLKSLEDASFIREQANIAGEKSDAVELNPEQTVIEHLYSTAYQGTSLALPIYGKGEVVSTLEPADLISFFKKSFVASNTALVATGDVDHEKLVEFASKLNIAEGLKPHVQPAHFLGSEVRFRDDNLPSAYVAIAVEGESLLSRDYFVAKVAAQVNGSYINSDPTSALQASKLSTIVKENHLADSYSHFSTSLTDSGLWGFYTQSSNIINLDDLMHFTLKDWNRFSTTVSEVEVERAKAQLKVLLLSKDDTVEKLNASLGINAIVSGYEQSSEEIISRIDKVSVADVTRWAGSKLWDQDIAISATGQIEALFDYNRLRNDMSQMRW
ncbi:BA75_01444T0 [Komagataella pastoris]|uniref:BA75_01444T0 n=1 Tax=Komagataella pastoris TaxID=4922 RepID=A0A1B2J5C3_PICPA|nr:BA75_01444T0 [Komagataella pastoris]